VRPDRPPGPLPDPPADLARRTLPLRTVSSPWYRFHPPRRPALFFGRTGSGRFDAPAGQFGTLYVAEDAGGAFAETFGQMLDHRSIDEADLSRRHLALIHPPRPLRLADVTGPGLARLGADARLFAGDHAVAHRWSLAVYRHPQKPDGILYRARHDPSRRAAAVFDRVKGRFRVKDLGRLDERGNLALLARLLDRYGFGLGT